MSPAVPHLWRNDITGLRALAVLPVLFFHAFPNLLPGGFFGVDIFFVISGYLIAGIIFRGVVADQFSYLDFYAKRIRRIIPNLLLVLLFVALSGALFMSAEEYGQLGKHIQSSTFFYENFRLLKESGYFDIESQLKPLLHLWSLAIEEQFYIFFPAIAAGLWALTSRFSASNKWPPLALGLLVTAMTIGSLLFCLLQKDPTKAFYYPRCRFWELGLGIILAWVETFRMFDFSRLAIGFRHALSTLGLVLIVGSIAFYSKEFRAPGWISLLPTVGAVALIAAGPQAIVNRSLLSWRLMTFVGLISYSVYLWHWPLLSFMHIVHPLPTAWMTALGLLLSFVISTGVYFWIELPVRRTSKVNAKRLVAILVVGMVISWGAGKLITLQKGLPNRIFCTASKDWLPTVTWHDYIDGMNNVEKSGGFRQVTTLESQSRILFAGDSHMYQYAETIDKLSHQSGISATILVAHGHGCVVSLSDSIIGADSQCRYFQKKFNKLINQSEAKTLVLSHRWLRYWSNSLYYVTSNGEKLRFDQGGLEANLRDVVSKLRPDLKVYVLLDNPRGNEYNPRKSAVNRWSTYLPMARSLPLVKIQRGRKWDEVNDVVQKIFSNRATMIDVTSELFPNGVVRIEKSYLDDDHLNPDWLSNNVKFFDEVFGLRQ